MKLIHLVLFYRKNISSFCICIILLLSNSIYANEELDPKKLYKTACFACHDIGIAGAPKFADKKLWAPRIATGIDAMVTTVVIGKGAMPPKGGTQFSETQIRKVVEYMANAASGDTSTIKNNILPITDVQPSTTANSSNEANIPSKEFAKCTFIKGELARLDCFDNLAKEKNIDGLQPQQVNIQDKGKWQVNIDKNPVDDSKTVSLVLNADSGKSAWNKKIFMVIRCKSNKTEMYINWRDYLGNKASVLTRIGDNKARTKTWGLSSDSKASFHPRGTIGFLNTMMKSNKFLAQITPYSETPVTAIFNTTGLKNAIKPLRETCGWTEAQIKLKNEQKELKHKKAVLKRKKALKSFKGFIKIHRGSHINVRLSEWRALDSTSQKLLDDAIRIDLVNDDDSSAIKLPTIK